MLRKFYTQERIAQIPANEIELLRQKAEQGDVFAQCGYARYLWTMQPDKTSATKAREMLLNVVDQADAPADAEMFLAITYRYGGCAAWDMVDLDHSEYQRLRQNALDKGSLFAEITMARNRIYGFYAPCEPETVAKEVKKRLESEPDCDPYWHVILAYALDNIKRRPDAIAQYEAAIKAGEVSAYADLGWTYMLYGRWALGEAIMEDGLKLGIPGCHQWQTEMLEQEFRELSPEEQKQYHDTIEPRCVKGTALGDGGCAYFLGHNYYHGSMGFEPDPLKAMIYLERAIMLGDNYASDKLADLMEDDSCGLPQQLRYSPEQIAGLRLTTVRRAYDDDRMVEKLKKCVDMGFLLRHQQEIQREWQHMFKEVKPKRYHDMPIDPTVILIWPSGHFDTFETDVYKMKSYGEMAETIIHAKRLDAIHWSPKLESIAKTLGLEKSLVMYVDAEAEAKNLKDNMIATLLYGQATEIRGPIIIALEDERHECYSFTDYNDLMDTANEIKRLTGGLLIIKDEDDGRWDAYA
jgi:TPR repeat protein